MTNYKFLKKPIKYSYVISGYLSFNEVLYAFMYRIKAIRDEDNKKEDNDQKIKLMYKFIMIRFFILLSLSLLISFQDVTGIYKYMVNIIIISHITYLFLWQIAYFFNLSNYIDDISRNDLQYTDALLFSLVNFFEIIICFSIIFLLMLNDFDINKHFTEISHLYFSFSNMTTLNGGDMCIPKTNLSQVVSIIEAIIGVFYLIINFPILIQNTHKK